MRPRDAKGGSDLFPFLNTISRDILQGWAGKGAPRDGKVGPKPVGTLRGLSRAWGGSGGEGGYGLQAQALGFPEPPQRDQAFHLMADTIT